MNQEMKNFIQFLVTAKQRTYASGAIPKPAGKLGAHLLEYEDGELFYMDTYLGGQHFIGEEVVAHAGRPIWGMNYYGKMLIDDEPEGFNQCLKQALLRVSKEAPYRGPEVFRSGPFTYQCNWSGKPDGFEGYEIICMNGADVYKLLFHGGEII